jgi:hypothetical protein
MFKRLFSGSVDKENETPLLSYDEKDYKIEDLTRILTLEEVQAMAPRSFMERMRKIRQDAELSNDTNTKLVVEQLIKPNMLFEAKLRQETVAYFIHRIQEWSFKTKGLAFHFDYHNHNQSESTDSFGKLIYKIAEYRHNHKLTNPGLFNSLVADHLRAVLKLIMDEFSQITGFQVSTEVLPGTFYLEETKTKFIVRIHWA